MEIELVPTKVLIDELEKRFDTMVFAGLTNLDDQFEKEITRHKGHFRTSQGLCMNLILKLSVVPGTETMSQDDM
jgi:hypothetical protein